MTFVLSLTLLLTAADAPGVVKTEFIYEKAPFPECHASTIVATKAGLTAAWFGGTEEGKNDVGIWVATHDGQTWSEPREVATGVVGDNRYPCWNPVLFQPKEGPLLLFYKVGPNPREWWGMLKTSTDAGKSWSSGERLPDGILGPIKNKPIQLASGDILSPTSSEHDGWRVHFERSSDNAKTWQATSPVNDGKTWGAIQPSILRHKDGQLQSIGRSRQSKLYQVWSHDEGKTWGEMTATSLPNPNSGTDAITMADGRHALIYNHTARVRSPLNLAISTDGKTWHAALVLEDAPGEYSYPAIIQTDDGLLHITYTWKRERVKHVVVDPAKLSLREIVKGEWPK